MTSKRATTPPMIQPTGVELVSDCATIVVGVTAVVGASVVVATVGSVVEVVVAGSVVEVVVAGSVVEGAVVEGTSVVTVVVVLGVVVEGTVAEGGVTDGEVSGRFAFPAPPQAATVPARTMSPTANHRRPRRATPLRPSARVVPMSVITWLSLVSPAVRINRTQPPSTPGLAPPAPGKTVPRGLRK